MQLVLFWSKILLTQNLQLKVTCHNNKGVMSSQSYSITAFNSLYYYEPVFTLSSPIHIPGNIWEKKPNDNEFPIMVKLELSSDVLSFQFDVMLVYDAAIE